MSGRSAVVTGASGLVGTRVMQAVPAHPSLRLVALSRREVPIPRGSRMEMMVADPAGWTEAVAAIAPEAVICALGTTRRKAGSEEAFRAVDQDLVLRLAAAAKDAGAGQFVLVSSVGADALSKTFYSSSSNVLALTQLAKFKLSDDPLAPDPASKKARLAQAYGVEKDPGQTSGVQNVVGVSGGVLLDKMEEYGAIGTGWSSNLNPLPGGLARTLDLSVPCPAVARRLAAWS